MDFGYRGEGVQIYEPVVILRPEQIRIGDRTRIDSLTKLEGGIGIEIGAGVHIASFCHINVGGGEVVIGDEAGLSSGVRVCGGMSDLAYPSASPAAGEGRFRGKRGRTIIGARAVLFAGCTILPDVTIGEDAVISAGAVVTKNVPAGEVWAGVPARKLTTRRRLAEGN